VFCRLPALLLAALSVLLTSGCATALKSETQPVDVELVNADGSRWRTPAVCTVRNSAQEIRGNGPMFDVKVERSMSALRVECRARCGTVGSTTASSRTVFAGMTGLVIDHLSGKLYDYPRVVKVVMQPLPDAQPDTTLMAARDRAVNGSSARAAAAVTLSGPAAASASAAGGTAPAASSQATAAAAR
jgi:hypothetical protein